MRHEITIPLSSGRNIKMRYANEEVSPETYYDHMHDHSVIEICIFLSGSMLHFSGGHTYRLSHGDIFFALPGELHYAVASESSVYERYAVWIPKDAFSFILGGNESALGVFSDPNRADVRVFRLREECYGQLPALLENLHSALITPEEPMISFARLCELLCFINRNSDQRNEDPSFPSKSEIPQIIHKVIRYVRDNYQTLKGVDEIATTFYINRDYLTRVFSKYMGITVHDYIRIIRINRARAMLSEGGGVTETAYACGFNSTSYFIRVFSRSTGITPARFRARGGALTSKNE